jgi:hypothetical protein
VARKGRTRPRVAASTPTTTTTTPTNPVDHDQRRRPADVGDADIGHTLPRPALLIAHDRAWPAICSLPSWARRRVCVAGVRDAGILRAAITYHVPSVDELSSGATPQRGDEEASWPSTRTYAQWRRS